jgi:hypothetical protein
MLSASTAHLDSRRPTQMPDLSSHAWFFRRYLEASFPNQRHYHLRCVPPHYLRLAAGFAEAPIPALAYVGGCELHLGCVPDRLPAADWGYDHPNGPSDIESRDQPQCAFTATKCGSFVREINGQPIANPVLNKRSTLAPKCRTSPSAEFPKKIIDPVLPLGSTVTRIGSLHHAPLLP